MSQYCLVNFFLTVCLFFVDFNFQPTEAAYSLLMGLPLLSSHEDALSDSRVVHVSIDPTIPITAPKATEDEEGEGSTSADPDKVIKNARAAIKSDGLLSSEELSTLYETSTRPKSAYEEGQRLLFEASNQDVVRCGERLKISRDRKGAFEPEWTNYTFYWQLSLGTVSIYVIVSPTHSIHCRLFIHHRPSESLVFCVKSAQTTQDRGHPSRVAEDGRLWKRPYFFSSRNSMEYR